MVPQRSPPEAVPPLPPCGGHGPTGGRACGWGLCHPPYARSSWGCHLPPQAPCLGVPGLSPGLTCSGKRSWTLDVTGKKPSVPSWSLPCWPSQGTHDIRGWLSAVQRGLETPGGGEGSRKPEPTCGPRQRRVPPVPSRPHPLHVVVAPAGSSGRLSATRSQPRRACGAARPRCWGTRHPHAYSACPLLPPPAAHPGWRVTLVAPTWVLFQGTPDPGEGSAPFCADDTDDSDVLRTRHARHARKRRRLV